MAAPRPLLFLLAALTFLEAIICVAWAHTSPQTIYDDLRAILSSESEVVLTQDPTYTRDFTPRYNTAGEPSYIVGVKPALVTDVQRVVQLMYAVGRNISFLTTGGGHGYSSSLGRLEDGINVDLGMFSTVQVDSDARTMTVGGAVRADQVATALQAAGMEIRATLGGGIGPYSGLYGPISDSLLSVEMVTGDGRLLNVSQTEHQDLFYAVKGAGFNYGVATSLTYRIYPATNGGRAMNADMIFPGCLNGSVWELARQFAATQPKELSIGFSVRSSFDPTLEGIIITANFIYAGSEDAGVALIQPFLDLQPLHLNISTVMWKDIPAVANHGAIPKFGCKPGIYYVPYGLNLYQVDVQNLIHVVNYMDDAMTTDPTLQGAFVVWQQYAPYGFNLQAQDSSAFPHRDTVAFIQVDGVGVDATRGPALNKFGREARDLLQRGNGQRELGVYVHFAHGDEAPAAFYSSAKLSALEKLKDVYDPSGLFSWYNPVVSRATR
ncbi:hypothetical protein DL769_009519 [Monosporascus sp. CRB-8-3]|nr:hypothetical protein DL769_009519 [Monosporascus sp. CRB-8-3]